VWEMTVKYQLGKLPLPENPVDFARKQREVYAIEPIDLTDTAIRHLLLLPDYHRDPFDRMLICQALAHGLTILTPDHFIQRYPVLTAW